MKTIIFVNHAICPDLIRPGGFVLDLGANLGEFANAMAERFQCNVYAVEASPEVFARIPQTALVSKFNVAICAASGPVKLNISSNIEATSLKRLDHFEYVNTISIPGLSLDEFVKTHDVPAIDLLKVDIEGAEIEMFNSCSDAFLQSIDQITVEFHPWAGVSTQADVKKVLRRLRALGFYIFNFSRSYYSDVLFVNRRRMSRFEYLKTMLGMWVPRILRYPGRRLGFGAGK